MGFHGGQLVGEPIQFGSYKGLGWEKHHLSLWVQGLKTVRGPRKSCQSGIPQGERKGGGGVVRLRDAESLDHTGYLSRWRSVGGGNSPCGNGGHA